MKVLSRIIAAVLFVAIHVSGSIAQQSSVLDQLRGSPSGSNGGPTGLGGGLQSGYGSVGQGPDGIQGGVGAINSVERGLPSLTNMSRPRPPQEDNADARRRAQELELRQLHQKLDQLEAGTSLRNSFQTFVLQSTGRDLPLFGLNLFKNTPSTFVPIENAPATPDYLIGPGDQILISGWGQVSIDLDLLVDRNGTINIPRVGMINVAGLKYQDLIPHLKASIGKVYRNFDLTASLGQLRSIQIYVVGQAKRPGTYTLSSLSTLVSAIFAAGGPSNSGSMRSVQLKRNNKVVTDFDLYELLTTGDKSRDSRLLPGDIIQFLPIGSLVAMNGAVNNPAIYELKQDTPFFDVLRWAGGLATTAQGQKATVERIENRKSRKVEEFSMDAAGLSKPLKDGDLVSVHTLVPQFENAVTLRGNVAQPGRFPWRDGMRIRDLIPQREILLSREYVTKRNQAVGLEPNVARILSQQGAMGTLSIEDLSQRRKPAEEQDATIGDTIQRIQSESEAARFLSFTQGRVAGPVAALDPKLADATQSLNQQARDEQAKLERERLESLRLVNQIRPSVHEVNWDYALVERMNQDLSSSLLPFNLGKALDGDPQQNLTLQPGDIVTIFSKEDLRGPVARKTKYVRLEGELNSAGVYEIRAGETLRQLLVRVGGLTPNAYLFGATFTRESTRVEQQKNIDEALSRLERDIQRYNIVRSQNVTSAEDAVSLKQQAENQQQLIARLRQIRATGRIVLEIPEHGDLRDIPDLTLEDGDRLLIPSTPSMVSVFGSVYSENSFIYRPQKQVSDYLTQAGGPTRSADRSSVYVLRADGSVLSKQQSGFLNSFDGTTLMPGDSIVVPEELDRTTMTRALKDISQIFYQFGLGAAAIKVLRQ